MQLYGARPELGVDHLAGPRGHDALDLDDRFGTQPVRRRDDLGGREARITAGLQQARAVAQVEKYDRAE